MWPSSTEIYVRSHVSIQGRSGLVLLNVTSSQFDPDVDLGRIFSGASSHGSYPRAGWGDSISGRNVDREGAAMNQPETGEAPEAAHNRSDLQKELAEVLRQRAAISAVLRAIANCTRTTDIDQFIPRSEIDSPHDLQPIFDAILDNAVHLCRAEWGAFRLVEEIGFRLVAYKVSPALSELWSPPTLRGTDNFIGRLFGSKSPVHIPDLA